MVRCCRNNGSFKKDIAHPVLKLFTIDEETGMTDEP
jgi:hypothetical protein